MKQGRLILIGAVLMPGLVFAASETNKGLSPKGKPFVEINGQIAEVINDVSVLQQNYADILARVEAIEGLDLQGQIDAINVEIQALKDNADLLQTQIEDVGDIAVQNGLDLDYMMVRLDEIDDEIDTLESTTGDNTQAIADLEAEEILIKEAIAANADGLLELKDDYDTVTGTIGLLEGRISNLEANKQNDITGQCGAGAAVTTVNDDGTLVCEFVDGGGQLVRYATNSAYKDLDNYTASYYVSQTCYSWWYSYECGYWVNYQVSGSGAAQANCPSGYHVAGGGHYYNDQNGDTVRVQNSRPYGNGWYVYFNQTATGNTSGHYGYAFVNCLKTN